MGLLISLIAGGWAYYNHKQSYRFGNWPIPADEPTMRWIPFAWAGDNVGPRYYDKLAMLVPVSIEGIPAQFECQFDIGSNLTMLYGNPVNSLAEKFSFLRNKKHEVRGKDTVTYLEDLRIKIGSVAFESPQVNVLRNFGESLPVDSLLAGPRKVGTIGVDICKNRVLVIDYPRKRLCITKQLSTQYKVEWTPISLDDAGRAVLPLYYNGRQYKVLYDCGSSMFALLASHRTVRELTTADATDTVVIPSWGQMLQVIGRPMAGSFTLAGHTFSGINVYSNGGSEEIVPEGVDAVTGNALFLDKIVVIDFKNKRFGIAR